MHLYKRFNSTIDIYKVEPNESKMREYKESKMRNIPQDQLLFDIPKQMIDSYIKSTIPYGETFVDKDKDGNNIYLLVPYNTEDIVINIPISLYQLERYLQEGLQYTSELSEDDLEALSRLFKIIGPIASFDTDMFNKIYEFGLIPDISDDLDHKINCSNKVFNLTRKR